MEFYDSGCGFIDIITEIIQLYVCNIFSLVVIYVKSDGTSFMSSLNRWDRPRRHFRKGVSFHYAFSTGTWMMVSHLSASSWFQMPST